MKKIFLGFSLLLLASSVNAQSSDTLFISRGVAYAKNIHSQRIRSESLLFNGVDIAEYQPLDEEHPYLYEDWVGGSIFYDEQLFDSVYLRYNTYTDNILIENYNFGATIQLIRDRVDHFTMGNRLFVLLNHAAVPPGFYEVLYQGETRIIAKRKKAMQEYIESGRVTREFEEKPKYYAVKDNQYFPITSKKSLLNLFGEWKQDVNKKFQSRNISFKKNKEKAIVAMAELYDTVNH